MSQKSKFKKDFLIRQSELENDLVKLSKASAIAFLNDIINLQKRLESMKLRIEKELISNEPDRGLLEDNALRSLDEELSQEQLIVPSVNFQNDTTHMGNQFL